MNRKSHPVYNWTALGLVMLSMLFFMMGVLLIIYAMSTRVFAFNLIGSVFIGAGVLFGLLAALWWNAPARND